MKIAVIGAGSWGTAISGVAAAKAGEVMLWSHDEPVPPSINERHLNPLYLTDYTLPENVRATCSFEEALAGAAGAIVVVPSPFIRATIRSAARFVADDLPILCLTKGIEPHTGKLMHEVIAEELGSPERIAALTGPNHAEEICRGKVAAAVIASETPRVGEFFKELLISPSFRLYASNDMVGIETCGAVKNVIAIACGIAAGAGYGDNTLALIMTRGLAEISRIVCARGGDPMTCMGLAGMGDLVATCTSPHSRNRSFGVAFAGGESLEHYQERTHMIVEGAAAVQSTAELARSLGVDAPITFVLESLLYNNMTLDEALNTLMGRVPTEEFYGLDRD